MLKISLGNTLNELLALSNMEIRKTYQFMKEGFSNIEERFKEADVYKEEFKYYIEKIENHPEILDDNSYKGKEAREMLSRIDIVGRMYQFANDQQEIAYRMAHIFFITTYEAFIRNLLKIIFSQDRSLLISNKYKAVDIALKSDKEIKEFINSRIESLVNVHNLEDFFKNKLKIEISSIFSEWDSFIENFYRRHVIVHHHGIISEKYVERTNSSKNLVGTEINSTFDYIKIMANNTCTLMGLLTGHILSYFGCSITSTKLDPLEILEKLKKKP